MQSKVKRTVTIIGAGSFGTSLAIHLARLNYKVNIWAREELVAESINKHHRNSHFLNQVQLPELISSFSDLTGHPEFFSVDMIVLAVPTQFLRDVLRKLKGVIPSDALLVSVVKGIETTTECFPSQIVEQELSFPRNSLVVLSGPSFAIEIAQQQPTGIAAASKTIANALKVQEIFHSPSFRVYTNEDPTGLEVAGALKNVISIAAGACAGLGYQNNSLATIITRGLSEIVRIGVALGASPLTFSGLGGVGDLLLTCSSSKSRNYTVGYRLGKGEKLEDILSSLQAVAEGVATAFAAHKLCKRLKVRASIINAVYKVLYEKKALQEAVHELTHGDAHSEQEF